MKGGTEPPWHHRAPSSRIRRDDAVAAGETPPREPTTQVMRERWGQRGRGQKWERDGESECDPFLSCLLVIHLLDCIMGRGVEVHAPLPLPSPPSTLTYTLMIVAMARMVVPSRPAAGASSTGAAGRAARAGRCSSERQQQARGPIRRAGGHHRCIVDHDGRMVTHRSRRGRSRHCGDDD